MKTKLDRTIICIKLFDLPFEKEIDFPIVPKRYETAELMLVYLNSTFRLIERDKANIKHICKLPRTMFIVHNSLHCSQISVASRFKA
jgi:hypothetical protein